MLFVLPCETGKSFTFDAFKTPLKSNANRGGLDVIKASGFSIGPSKVKLNSTLPSKFEV